MFINPISRISFQGKYIDRSEENGGLRYMEYSPYSWESDNTSKMAPIQRLNILSDELPDNEEIYTPFTDKVRKIGRESSKDLLGTEFRFVNNTGLFETSGEKIIPVSAMNLENSLIVQLKKIDIFLNKKSTLKDNLQKMFESNNNDIGDAHKEFLNFSEKYDKNFFGKKKSKNQMDNSENILATKSLLLMKNIKNYIQLEKSIDKFEKEKENNSETLKLLWYMRRKNNLIDISCADKKNQMLPLLEFLHSISPKNIQDSAQKVIVLPHKVIFIEKLLNTINTKIGDTDFVQKVLSTVQDMIKKKL